MRALSLVTVTRMTPRDMVATLSVCLFHSLIVGGGGGGGGEQAKSLDRTRITSVICVVSLADYVLTPTFAPAMSAVVVFVFLLEGKEKKVIKHNYGVYQQSCENRDASYYKLRIKNKFKRSMSQDGSESVQFSPIELYPFIA